MVENQVAIASVPMKYDMTMVEQRNTIVIPFKEKEI